MKYVKELLEELQRFNPEARLEHEVEVCGVSPATQCTVIGGSFDDIEELKRQAKDLDERNDELLLACKKIRSECEIEDSKFSKSILEFLDNAEA